MLQFIKERAAKTNARDETFLEGMNIFRENEKMMLADHLLLTAHSDYNGIGWER